MANGDAAGAAGLPTWDENEPVNETSDKFNIVQDEIAGDRDRLDALEAAALNPPVFSAYRGAAQNVGSGTWSVVASGSFTLEENHGFTSWSGGLLTIARSGLYACSAHVEFTGDDYSQVGVQLTQNTASPDTDNTIAKGEWAGPKSGVLNAGPTAYGMRRLAAGDVVRMLVLQINGNDNVWSYGTHKPDLTWTMQWIKP
ncbi:hypothetical protein [Curtobacterium sp. MCBD17_040]|uniref:hypothetical protein n=1 Tax=Curtobacterium sp. MCBD17_040 TaxID=2175674 RepID=UPI000DA942E0|nr:hypothetical protein [Curtobacterium sp. MCBD17_040]WIB64364.1 hypothetical protein DEI94_03985 [Curtobacterium sp. MCBD17_040]